MRTEPLSSQIRKIQGRRAALASIALAAIAPIGCLEKYFTKQNSAPVANQPKSVPATSGRLVAIWDKKVNFCDDQAHGGATMPTLVGRIYLVDDNMKVHYGDGSLIIDLYDCSPGTGHSSEPKLIDEMRIAPGALRQFAQKDFFGEGYHILFPWYTYQPEITNVNIMMRYEEDGKFWTEQSGTFPMNHEQALERIRKGMPVVNPAMKQATTLPASAVATPVN